MAIAADETYVISIQFQDDLNKLLKGFQGNLLDTMKQATPDVRIITKEIPPREDMKGMLIKQKDAIQQLQNLSNKTFLAFNRYKVISHAIRVNQLIESFSAADEMIGSQMKKIVEARKQILVFGDLSKKLMNVITSQGRVIKMLSVQNEQLNAMLPDDLKKKTFIFTGKQGIIDEIRKTREQQMTKDTILKEQMGIRRELAFAKQFYESQLTDSKRYRALYEQSKKELNFHIEQKNLAKKINEKLIQVINMLSLKKLKLPTGSRDYTEVAPFRKPVFDLKLSSGMTRGKALERERQKSDKRIQDIYGQQSELYRTQLEELDGLLDKSTRAIR